jgi:hypothetical protein
MLILRLSKQFLMTVTALERTGLNAICWKLVLELERIPGTMADDQVNPVEYVFSVKKEKGRGTSPE